MMDGNRHVVSTKRIATQGVMALTLLGIVVTLIITQLDKGHLAVAAQADTASEPIDPWVYDRTQLIRRELALTNEDLASMGLGREEAENVLDRLEGWVEQNRGQIEAKELGEMRAKRALQLAQRNVRVGPRDENLIRSLPGLEATLAEAIQSRENLHENAGKAIEAQLTTSQRAVWQTAKANTAADVPARYRYATSISSAQKVQISEAISKRSNETASIRYANADRSLNSTQRAAIETAEANRSSNIKAVRQAEEVALPVPPELAEEQDVLDP